MEIPQAWPRLMRPDVAAAYCGGERMLDELRTRYGLSPIRQQKRLTVYLRDSIDKAINQAAAEAPQP